MSAAVYKTNTGLLQGHPEDGGPVHSHTYTLSKNLMIPTARVIVCQFYKREINIRFPEIFHSVLAVIKAQINTFYVGKDLHAACTLQEEI